MNLEEGRGQPTQGRHRGHCPGSHRERAPRRLRHLAPGPVTARRPAPGSRPQKLGPTPCLPFSTLLTSSGDSLGCITLLTTLMLRSTSFLLALETTLGFQGSPCHHAGQAQGASPGARRAKGTDSSAGPERDRGGRGLCWAVEAMQGGCSGRGGASRTVGMAVLGALGPRHPGSTHGTSQSSTLLAALCLCLPFPGCTATSNTGGPCCPWTGPPQAPHCRLK